MKKLFPLLFCFHTLTPALQSQSTANTLDIVCWNIEWFGASFQDPANDDLQRENVKSIIRYLDADMYGLTEMVDTAQIRRLVDSLGTAYSYTLSDFCSNATAPGSAAWRNGQKLMFLYKNNVFSNVTARGLLRTSATAYTNWASGRFPYLLNADVSINGQTKNINFILIHGKAGSTATDYTRRFEGARELKDTLDAQYPNSINIIFGDFNDALNQTISTGSGPETSYQPIVDDSTDADHYKSITLPLAYAGQSTMINYPNVIDNHVISNEMTPFYVAGSASIRMDITSIVPDYVSAENTSDHWPVFSKFDLAGIINSVPDVSPAELGILAFPNPFTDVLNVRIAKNLVKTRMQLVNIQGQVLRDYYYPYLNAGTMAQPALPPLARGIYFLHIQTEKLRTVVKITKM